MQARLTEVNSLISNNSRNGYFNKAVPNVGPTTSQFPSSSMVIIATLLSHVCTSVLYRDASLHPSSLTELISMYFLHCGDYVLF